MEYGNLALAEDHFFENAFSSDSLFSWQFGLPPASTIAGGTRDYFTNRVREGCPGY
jgi:hypothetical protein